MPDTDRWWPGLAAITGLDVDDPRFNSHDKRCGENRLEMLRVLEERFRQHPAAHWKRVLTERQLSADVIEEFDYRPTTRRRCATATFSRSSGPASGASRPSASRFS